MARLIAESFDKDLRENTWEQVNYRYEGDILVQEYKTTEGKMLEVRTRFTGYDNAFGNPVITYQSVREL